jgi:hypothetical protein
LARWLKICLIGLKGASRTTLNFTGASENLSDTLFIADSPFGGETDTLWPGDTTLEGGLASLYEYAGTGSAEPELVGVRNQTSLAAAARLEGKSHIDEAARLISCEN